MKNKSTIAFYTFFLSCCFSLVVNAQKQNVKKDFNLNVIKYSDKSNLEKEHIHVLELTNNSKSASTYSISLSNDDCSVSSDKSNIKTKIYIKDSNAKKEISDIISLDSNESVKIYLETIQNSNAKLDSRNCTVIQANKVSKNKSRGSKSSIISESITIETLIRNPINRGH